MPTYTIHLDDAATENLAAILTPLVADALKRRLRKQEKILNHSWLTTD